MNAATTPLVWFKAVLTYVTPLCVSSIGVFVRDTPPQGESLALNPETPRR